MIGKLFVKTDYSVCGNFADFKVLGIILKIEKSTTKTVVWISCFSRLHGREAKITVARGWNTYIDDDGTMKRIT